MNDREQAIEVLQRARATLARRLAARLLDDHEGICEDAAGLSFMDEINAAYDQIGSKLQRVNQMLADLSAVRSTSPARPDRLLGLPAPRRSRPQPLAQISFQTFAAQIQAGDLESAGRSLATLFNLNGQRGWRCARYFDQKLRTTPDFFLKTLQLHRQLNAGGLATVVELLNECFGLNDLESVHVANTLRSGRSL